MADPVVVHGPWTTSKRLAKEQTAERVLGYIQSKRWSLCPDLVLVHEPLDCRHTDAYSDSERSEDGWSLTSSLPPPPSLGNDGSSTLRENQPKPMTARMRDTVAGEDNDDNVNGHACALSSVSDCTSEADVLESVCTGVLGSA